MAALPAVGERVLAWLPTVRSPPQWVRVEHVETDGRKLRGVPITAPAVLVSPVDTPNTAIWIKPEDVQREPTG